MGWMQIGGYIAVILVSYSFVGCYASDNAFLVPAESSGGRNLLQTKKSCTVNFEIQNYTIITSQCKGPQYPPKQCCDALLQFACPFADDINDATTDCADTMFSYINLHGKYPTGLFASECKGDNKGLTCSNPTPPAQSPDRSGSLAGRRNLPLVLAAPTILMLLMRFV